MPKSVQNPLLKKTLTLEAQKYASKVMDWVKTPPSPLRKNSITNPLFFYGFPRSNVVKDCKIYDFIYQDSVCTFFKGFEGIQRPLSS